MAFKKGQSGNPGGRPKTPEDVKELKKLNNIELERIINESLQLSRDQLKKIMADPESTMLQLVVASLLTQSVNKGDHMRLNFLLERLLGKVKENMSVTGSITIDRPLRELPTAELLKQLPEAVKILRDKNGQ